MRKTLLKVALFSCAFIPLSTANVQALSVQDFNLTDDPFSGVGKSAELEPKSDTPKPKPEATAATKVQPPAEKVLLQHTVVETETLTVIAEKYSTTWKRIFDKNNQIANPDILSVGEVLTIPEADEQLVARPLPVVVPASPLPITPNSSAPIAGSNSRGSTVGNTYAAGYCTWYAKNRRPDLPNRMGNAISWISSAAAQGYATGNAPRVGAIGQQGNHVAYVESVNGDGTVSVSEMNYSGLFIISRRTVSASSFTYIY